jgi:hypothetical protein
MMTLLQLDRSGQLLTGSFQAGMQDNLSTDKLRTWGLTIFYLVLWIGGTKNTDTILFYICSDLCC